MKQIIPLLLLALIATSCTNNVELSDYFDSSKPFKLVQNPELLDLNGGNEVSVTSNKYQLFLKWLDENNSNWIYSPASYLPNVYLKQENFMLLILENSTGVVISFTDENGNGHQYVKNIKKGELDFLYE